MSAKSYYLKSEKGKIGRIWAVLGLFLDFSRFDATTGGKEQCLCPRLWEGPNTYARGSGWSLMPTPEAMGGA